MQNFGRHNSSPKVMTSQAAQQEWKETLDFSVETNKEKNKSLQEVYRMKNHGTLSVHLR